jgi:hypothetical protein
MDLESQLHDTYQEEKRQRYLELIGHNDDYLYVPITEWTSDMFKCVNKQGIEKEQWNCPAYSEVSLNYITSEYVKDTDKPHFIAHGSTCCICYEPLTSNKNSYITECDHHFCKVCMTSHYNSTFLTQSFNCPLCRYKLRKCLWLESRYALEPWRLNNKKKISTNVDFEFQREFFNEDILLCKGCSCMDGCYQLVGSNHACEACKAWRHFTLEDLNHRCDEKIKPTTKERCCGKHIFRCLSNTFSFLLGYRRSLIMPS